MSLLPALGLHRAKAPTPPTDSKAAQRGDTAKNAAEENSALASALLDQLPEGDERDTIDEVLKQHKKLVKPEAAVFAGIESLEALAREKNPDKREQKIQAIAKVIAAVDDRRKALGGAITALKPRLQPAQMAAALAPAQITLSTIDFHLPDEFNGRLATPQFIRARIATLIKTPDEKRQVLEQAKRGFFDDDGNDITTSFGEKFKDAIEPVSTKGFERQSFYFDQFIAEPPRDKLEEIYKLSDRILVQGQQILDCGGKLRDVEALITKTGVPQTWWPPRFIETLQAWRKTERAMMDERVAERMKKDGGFDPNKITSVVDFLMDVIPEGAEQLSELAKNVEVLKAAAEFTAAMKDGYGLGAVGLEALKTGDFSKVPPNKVGLLSQGLEKSLNMMEASITTASSALSIADDAGASFAASFIPGLAIAAAGVKLALALKHLAEHSGHAIQTRIMRGDATRALGDGSMEDGGAFLNALENELSGRHKQITKDSIEVTTSGMELGGSIAEVAGGHYGMAASAVIKVTAKGISFGTKIVFTNIDWAEANRAKALLKEAQAGNPIARMEIFQASNLYAKMYVCVLCKEGNPLAQKFVGQRGLTEGDLNTAMSMKILREALMESADQKDENDIADSWLLENTGGIGKAAVKLGSKIAKIKEIGRGSRSIPYLADWIYNGPVAISEESFSAARKQALAAGLYDDGDDSGIGGKVKEAEKRLGQAETAMQAGSNPSSKEAKEQKKNLLTAVEALDALRGAIMAASPMTNPQGDKKKVEPHKGFTLYLSKLATLAREARARIDGFMQSMGLKDVGFTPTIGPNVLSAEEFKQNWKGAVEAACMADDDGGLAAALKSYEEASAKLAKATDQQKRRAATLDLEDALNLVIGGVKAAWTATGEVPAMQAYLQKITATAAAERRAADESLAGGANWPNAPAVPSPRGVTSDGWKEMWKAACDGGFCTKKDGDGGVGDAIEAMEKAYEAIVKAAPGKGKLAARRAFAKTVGKMVQARTAFLATQRDPASQVVSFVDAAYKRALSDQKRVALAGTLTKFTAVDGLTAAAWKQSYDNATDNGALVKASGANKAMDSALKEFASTKAKFRAAVQGSEFQEARVKAEELSANIEAVVAAIDSKAMGAEGYAEHEIMGPYLKRLRDAAQKELEDADLKRALAGDIGSTKFMASGFTLVAADFSRVKASAVEAGAIIPRKTGVSGALKAYAKSLGKSDAAPGDANLKKAAAADANALLVAVKGLAPLSANAQWQSFARTAVTVAQAEVDRLAPAQRRAA
ncbi:MAG TPA: hypothetical protein VM689_01185 [Aliidongia sp.]|nr:hypothetical protein [Aliidongia sp.]